VPLKLENHVISVINKVFILKYVIHKISPNHNPHNIHIKTLMMIKINNYYHQLKNIDPKLKELKYNLTKNLKEINL
jgi:hypothetical protein